MAKEYWITNSRFKLIVIVMLIIWFSLLVFWWMKAEEITNHPCEVCARVMGDNVNCYTGKFQPISKTFYSSNLSGFGAG